MKLHFCVCTQWIYDITLKQLLEIHEHFLFPHDVHFLLCCGFFIVKDVLHEMYFGGVFVCMFDVFSYIGI